MTSSLPENLSDLPEYKPYTYKTLANGETVYHRIAPELVPYGAKPTDPIAFSDAEGSWIIEYWLKGGPYKQRVYF